MGSMKTKPELGLKQDVFCGFFYKLFVTKVRGQEVWPDQCGDKNGAHVGKFFNNSRCLHDKNTDFNHRAVNNICSSAL